MYLSKAVSDISCECRINDIVSNEITEILNKTAEQWNITTQFCDEKQYFVLLQDKSTYVPYKFSREQVVKYTLETIDLYKDCNTEEKYDELFSNVYKICNDISLSLDLIRFIPEMLCQMVFTEAKYPEFYFMIERIL